MVGRLNEHITAVGQAQQMTRAQPRNKVRNNMVVGPSDEAKRNVMRTESRLQVLNGLPDLWSGIRVDARQDVWRTSQVRHTVGD